MLNDERGKLVFEGFRGQGSAGRCHRFWRRVLCTQRCIDGQQVGNTRLVLQEKLNEGQ